MPKRLSEQVVAVTGASSGVGRAVARAFAAAGAKIGLIARGVDGLQTAYCASKAAIRGFTDSLRSELIHDRSRVKVCMIQLPAVNTPQFDVVRTRLPRHPQPVPPIFQPEVIARGVLHLALHPRREMWVGWSAAKAIFGQKFIGGLLDRYLAKAGWDSQMDDRPIDPVNRRDNLAAPLPGDRGAHGDFDARSRTSSSELWMRLNAGKLAAGAAAAAAMALVTWRGLRG